MKTDYIKQFIKNHKIIIAILLLVFLKEILFAMIIPLWQNNDEIEHFAYTYYIVEEERLPITTGGSQLELTTSDELSKANQILMSDKISFAVFEKNQIIHQDFNNVLVNKQFEEKLSQLNRHDSSDKYKNATAVYSPLYYYFEAIPYKIFQNFSISTRAYAMRIFSILFMLVTVLFSFKTAKLFFKSNSTPYVVAILIGFLPRFSFTSVGINNDALVIAISTIAIYYLIRLLNEKLTLKHNLILGLIFGVGLLSKPQFYIFFLFLFIFYIYQLIKFKKIKPILISCIIVLLLAVLISSSWFWFNYTNRGSFPTSQISGALHLNNIDSTSIGLSDTLGYIFIRYIFLITSYFSMLGCCHEIYTIPIFLGLFYITIATGLFGYILFLYKEKKIIKNHFKYLFIFLIPVILELSYLLIYLRQPLYTGTVDFPIDGRYIFPVISALTIIFILGLKNIIPKKLHKFSLVILASGIIFINLFTLIFNIIPRYYL
ncbi:MAG: glycosyltransferase family 39 protein [bacterium]|nr:glycosyltransferase family 39 protein [bacterium]